MNLEKENYYLEQEYLSDIELYYSQKISGDNIELSGDESKHAARVMRHIIGDKLHVTDGQGNYFQTLISEISDNSISARIQNRKNYKNDLENIIFCFPRLKSNDRFEFEIEKSIELGITNFVIFNSSRTIPKGEKLERWNKIALAAMKQSLRTYLPNIKYLNSFEKIKSFEGNKIILEQKGNDSIINFLRLVKDKLLSEKFYFIFGPEGGLSQNELNLISDCKKLTLTPNRLRAETAVIATATVISLL